MPILHMETESVRGVGQQIQQLSGILQQQRQQLGSSVQSLSDTWQGPSASIFVGEIQPMLQQLNHFADTGSSLNQRLQYEVDEWERAGSQFGIGHSLSLSDLLRSTTGSTAIWGANPVSDPSNFWQAWAQIGESTDLFPHTKYHLIHGMQIEMKTRYLAGEMTWDQMFRNLEEMEKSLETSYLEKDFTLYRFAEGQGEIGAALWRDDWGGDNWNASLRAGSVEARGNYDFKLSSKGLEGGVQGEVGLYAVRGQYNAEVAGVDVAVDGYVGAQAKGQLGATIAPTAVMGTVGVSAFAGGRVDGSVSKDVKAAGVQAKGEARGGVSYGVGFKAEADVVLKPSLIKADVDFGATLGLGAELGFSFELDTTDAVNQAVSAGKDLVKFGSDGLKNVLAR